MRDLPPVARWFLITLWIIAASFLVFTLLGTSLAALTPLWLLWLAWYILADYLEVGVEFGDGGRTSVSIVDAPTIFSLAVSGPLGVRVAPIRPTIVDGLRCA